MEIEFSVNDNDFPANQTNKKIERISLFASLIDGTTKEIHVLLKFTPDGRVNAIDGGITKTNQGLISKLNSNADSWDVFTQKTPLGTWRLKLRDENDLNSFSAVEEMFNTGTINDLLFVITYKSDIADWI